MRIIPRRIDVEKIEKAKPWVMIYGRRKTGKTFLVENFINYDLFYFVNRDSTIIDKNSGEKFTYEEFITIFKNLLGRQRIVVDEFHRLPENFLDILHSSGTKGDLILITSTLWLSKKLLERRSPLLGIIHPIKIGLIDEREILLELSKKLKYRDLIETCVYLKEPFLIPFYKKPIRDFIANYIYESKLMIKELIGEIFTEEDKRLTNIYEGIMKAVADGKNISTEISTLLFSRGIISKDNPGVLQKYLDILTGMGILEKLEVVSKKKKFLYQHTSPLIDLHYYLEEKYSYTEIEVSKNFIMDVVDVKLPLHIEQFFRNLLSKLFGFYPKKIQDPEIDIALYKFKKLKLVGEIKWKEYINKKEIRGVEEKLNRFKEAKKYLIVPEESVAEILPEGVEIIDVEKCIELVKDFH